MTLVLVLTACSKKSEPKQAPPERVVATSQPAADWLGSQVCLECHEPIVRSWAKSHHGLAMQTVSEQTVLGDFDDVSFDYYGETTRFVRDAGAFVIETAGPDGEPTRYEIKHTFGVAPLQQYLVETEPGRLQAFPIAWDARAKTEGGQRWFHLQPDEHIRIGDPLHWTGPSFNWNNACAACHSTGVAKNYDRKSRRYATRFAEIDVSCEACHGPALRHVAMARAGELVEGKGFVHSLPKHVQRLWSFAEGRDIAQLQSAPRTDELEVCAPCHSRRAELGADAGGYHDRYRLELLDPVLYFDDGQIKDEVFVYGSFLQSKMHAAGVVCSDCHEPHSLGLRAEGNALCTRCHRASTYDREAHSLHKPGTAGSDCVDCHMPERTYMGVDDRSDHRFGIPQPLVSEAVDATDACTSCHEGKTPKWAAKHIAAHFQPRDKPAHVAALAAARRNEPGAAKALIEVATSEEQPDIIRATALEELALLPSPSSPEALSKLSKDESPLVRRGVVSAAQGMPPALRAPIVRPLLSDPVRVLRLAAVAALLGVDQQDWTEADRGAFAKALEEYRALQEFTADRGEGLSDLAHLATLEGDFEQALSLLRQANEVDPSFTAAYVNQADVYRATGRNADAEAVLRRGMTRAADPSAIEHALGLTLVRMQQHDEALRRLAAAHEQRPEVLRYGYVYAVALFDLGQKEESIAVLERMHDEAPGNDEILALLVNYLTQTQQRDRAAPYAKKLRQLVQTR